MFFRFSWSNTNYFMTYLGIPATLHFMQWQSHKIQYTSQSSSCQRWILIYSEIEHISQLIWYLIIVFRFPEVLAVYSGTNLYYRKGGRKEGREEGRTEGRKEGGFRIRTGWPIMLQRSLWSSFYFKNIFNMFLRLYTRWRSSSLPVLQSRLEPDPKTDEAPFKFQLRPH